MSSRKTTRSIVGGSGGTTAATSPPGFDNGQNTETLQFSTKMTLKELKQKQEQLKQQLAEVEEEIRVAEDRFVPNNFVLQEVLNFLDNPDEKGNLNAAFEWASTPQGQYYWLNIYNGDSELISNDIIQIQKWVINFMRFNPVDAKGDSF